MTKARLWAAVALAIGVAGTGATSASASTVPQAVNPGVVLLTKGQPLTVRVSPANSGSTGYHWRVASKKSRKVLRLRSSRPNAAGTRQVLRFTARRVGFTRLRLQYVSPGRPRKVAKRSAANVLVNPAPLELDCDGFTGETILRNNSARLFSVHRTALVYRRVTASTGKVVRVGYDAYFACEFAANKAIALSSGLPAHDEFYNPVLSRSVLGYVARPACPLQFVNEGCIGAEPNRVESIDLHTGKLIRSVRVGHCGDTPDRPGNPDCSNNVTGLVMSPAGGLAWIEFTSDFGGAPPFVHRSDRPPAAPGESFASDNDTLGEDDPGLVDPDSLRYDGNEISYVRDGKVERAPLQ